MESYEFHWLSLIVVLVPYPKWFQFKLKFASQLLPKSRQHRALVEATANHRKLPSMAKRLGTNYVGLWFGFLRQCCMQMHDACVNRGSKLCKIMFDLGPGRSSNCKLVINLTLFKRLLMHYYGDGFVWWPWWPKNCPIAQPTTPRNEHVTEPTEILDDCSWQRLGFYEVGPWVLYFLRLGSGIKPKTFRVPFIFMLHVFEWRQDYNLHTAKP